MRGHVAFAAALAAIAPVGGGHVAGAQCPQPYLPVHAAAYVSGESPAEGKPELDEHHTAAQPVLDTDGDGLTDRAEVDGDIVRITRGSGVLELAVGPGPTVAPRSLGDLDGDARSDVALVIDSTTVIVPGSTPDGSHDALSVGVQTWQGQQPGPWVGDQDGDGIDDVAVVEPGGDPIRLVSVVSGAALMAAGAGGTVEGRIDPILTLDADLHGLADLGRPAPTLLTYRWTQDPTRGEVTVHLPEAVRLHTADVAAPPPDVFSLAGDRQGLVTAWTTTDGHRAIVLARADRGGGTVHVWDLDAPCADASATITPTTASSVAAPAGDQTASDGPPRTGDDGTVVFGLAGAAVLALGALFVRRSRSMSVGGRDQRLGE